MGWSFPRSVKILPTTVMQTLCLGSVVKKARSLIGRLACSCYHHFKSNITTTNLVSTYENNTFHCLHSHTQCLTCVSAGSELGVLKQPRLVFRALEYLRAQVVEPGTSVTNGLWIRTKIYPILFQTSFIAPTFWESEGKLTP